MPRLVWDAMSERYYEYGVSHGVLYVKKDPGEVVPPEYAEHADLTDYRPGVVWNGLVNVTNTRDGFDSTRVESDGFVYDILRTPETLSGSIEAYTYPDQFNECDGLTYYSNGVLVGQQKHRAFGLCYRTELGPAGYLIHVIYNCTANLGESEDETVNDNLDAKLFHWDFDTLPCEVDGYSPFSELIFDSRKIPADKMQALEDMLYGNAAQYAALLQPAHLLLLVYSGAVPSPYPSGGGVVPIAGVFTANGTYTAETGYAWTPVTVEVPSGGDDENFTRLIEGNFYPSYVLINNDATVIRDYAFYGMSQYALFKVELNGVSQVGRNVFGGGTNYKVSELHMNSLTNRFFSYIVEDNWEWDDTGEPSWNGKDPWENLKKVEMNAITRITGLYSEYIINTYWPNLEELTMNSLESIGTECIMDFPNLVKLNLLNCSYIGTGCFVSKAYLSNLNIPNCRYIGTYVFGGLAAQEINLPKVEHIGNEAFYPAHYITSINLPAIEHIGSAAFCSCDFLTKVTIGADTYASIHAAAFAYCDSLERVLVPQSYLSRYKEDAAIVGNDYLIDRFVGY